MLALRYVCALWMVSAQRIRCAETSPAKAAGPRLHRTKTHRANRVRWSIEMRFFSLKAQPLARFAARSIFTGTSSVLKKSPKTTQVPSGVL